MEFKRLFDALPSQLEENPLNNCLLEKSGGKWVSLSTKEVLKKVELTSLALLGYGLKPGDKIAIISPNRIEWNIVDIAALQAGIIVVPIYPNISYEEYSFILNDAEIKLIFTSDKGMYRKLEPLVSNVSSIEKLITFNKVDGKEDFENFLKNAEKGSADELKNISNKISETNLATIIYTSGTTGVPKGVMLSHLNVVSNVKAVLSVVPIQPGYRVLTFLPHCHILERVAFYSYLYKGVSIYYAEGAEKLVDNLKETQPHFFTTVPRLLEKFYEKILENGSKLNPVMKLVFNWAHSLGLRYKLDGKGLSLFYKLQLAIADKLVFKKWRAVFGNHIVGIVAGAAALQPRLATIFAAAGIPVKEGYGQTESSPVISINQFGVGETRIGTVGKAIPGVTIKIAEDGEICIQGPNVMMGYYKRPDLTAEAIDSDGWLHTGDVGIIVDGFLKITDRKKELFKLSSGKYVSPQSIENRFKESFFVGQIMIVGENKKTVSALIVPAFAALESWAKNQNISFTNPRELLNLPETHKLFASVRDKINPHLSEQEKVKKFLLIPDEWSVETGEMTPTLKLKRKVILAKYNSQINELYGE